MKQFLYVNSDVLPAYFVKVLKTKRLLDSGVTKSVTEAAKANGISRSTYYKYKDSVFESLTERSAHRATFMLSLSHEKGILSNVLCQFSTLGLNVLTISQSPPINNIASVMISADLPSSENNTDEIIALTSQIEGVKQIQLLALS